MTAIGRALMAQPSMILLDEPSMGLAPQIVEEIFEIVRNLNRGEGVVPAGRAEHDDALRATGGYILENGRVVTDGVASELLQRGCEGVHLGLSTSGRRAFATSALPPQEALACMIDRRSSDARRSIRWRRA
jgi:branched-chain amino acid transport system ATP-binding protein